MKTQENRVLCVDALFEKINTWEVARLCNIDPTVVEQMTRRDLWNAVSARTEDGSIREVLETLDTAHSNVQSSQKIYLMNSHYLGNPEDVSYANWADNLQMIAHMQSWLRNIMTKRCPYLQPCLDKQLLWMAVAPERDMDSSDIEQTIIDCANQFSDLPSSPKDKIFRAMLVLFPTLHETLADSTLPMEIAMLNTTDHLQSVGLTHSPFDPLLNPDKNFADGMNIPPFVAIRMRLENFKK